MTAFEVVDENTDWQGRIIRAGSETYRYEDGSENTFDKIWHPGAVTIIPFDETSVWLVRQPREAAQIQDSLEIPAGKRDRPGEPLLDLAKRELIEEVGKEAGEWRQVLEFFPTPGFCDEFITVYAATDLSDADGGPGARGGRAHRDRRLAADRHRRCDQVDEGRKDPDRPALASARARALS